VHRVLSSLAYNETPLLVVPNGSANDFARCLGIPNRSGALLVVVPWCPKSAAGRFQNDYFAQHLERAAERRWMDGVFLG
jgi:hypothetical protein